MSRASAHGEVTHSYDIILISRTSMQYFRKWSLKGLSCFPMTADAVSTRGTIHTPHTALQSYVPFTPVLPKLEHTALPATERVRGSMQEQGDYN